MRLSFIILKNYGEASADNILEISIIPGLKQAETVMLTSFDVKFIFDSACCCFVFSQQFVYFFLVKQVKCSTFFVLTTKTTQPRLQVFLVNSSIIWQFCRTIDAIFNIS